jgi:hypothetical protein
MGKYLARLCALALTAGTALGMVGLPAHTALADPPTNGTMRATVAVSGQLAATGPLADGLRAGGIFAILALLAGGALVLLSRLSPFADPPVRARHSARHSARQDPTTPVPGTPPAAGSPYRAG